MQEGIFRLVATASPTRASHSSPALFLLGRAVGLTPLIGKEGALPRSKIKNKVSGRYSGSTI